MAALFFVICALGVVSCLSETCAVFDFHGKDEQIIHVQENTTLTLIFYLHKDRCNKTVFQNFSIDVSKIASDNEIGATYCSIRHVNGKCISPAKDNCTCGELPGRYVWRNTVSKYDALPAKWVWHTSNKQTEKKELQLSVTCPPPVLSGLPKKMEILVGESTDMTISIQSYARITEHKLCSVKRETEHNSMCDRFKLNLTGVLPDLNLTVRLDNVRKQDEGLWRLELTNHCRAKYLFFNLDVVESAVFEFPTLKSPDIHIQENERLELKFKLNKDRHPERKLDTFQKYAIVVTRVFGDTHATICSIVHENDKCVKNSSNHFCYCLEEQGAYMFKRTVHRSDSRPTRWIWSVSERKAVAKEFVFDVKYPARITEMKFVRQEDNETHIADRNTTFDLVCFWENGNPSVTARLLDRYGVDMRGSMDSIGQIRYTFTGVGCQDAGLIHCQAPGASHNKTTRLLVKCPPDVKVLPITVEEGQISEMTFIVRSHTRALACVFRRHRLETTPERCDGNSTSVIGNPPDLNLTIRLENVRKEDEGQWRLELSNDVGTTHLDFTVTVLAPPTSVMTIAITVALGFGAFAAVVAAIAAACVQARRMSNRWKVPRDSALIYLQTKWRQNRTTEEALTHADLYTSSTSIYDVPNHPTTTVREESRLPLAYAVSVPLADVEDTLTPTDQQTLGLKKQHTKLGWTYYQRT